MIIEQFISNKITQMTAYVTAVINKKIHYTELDIFINESMEEWASLRVSDATPASAQERVFWHLVHEISLHSAQALHHNLFFKNEISACLSFLNDEGSYPIYCIGWRPLP